MNIIRLAWKYIRFNRLKTGIMIACLTLTLLLPIALSILLAQFNRQIVARAESTPFVVGSPGSQLDLTLHSIYFTGKPPEPLQFGKTEEIAEDQLAVAIPVYARYTARDVPIVGTTPEYFQFRNMEIDRGEMLTRIGQCVLGYNVARRLDLEPGDKQLTRSTNVTDIAGEYPVNLHVCGVLKPTGTADDNVIFVDLKTTWVIEGLGHGHEDVASAESGKTMGEEGNNVMANAGIVPFVEFTDETAHDVHFHGDMNEFPITNLIVVPKNEESAAILLSRVNRNDATEQMVEPIVEVENLMSMVFQVQKLFNANAGLVGLSTVMLVGLVMLLSLRLRKQEMETMFRIGCARGTVISLQIAELGLILCFALAIVAVCAIGLIFLAPNLIGWFSGIA